MTRLPKKMLVSAAAVLMSASGAFASDVEFMNWTYTEESGKELIQEMMDSFKAKEGLEVEPQGYEWGAMTKNTLLRSRSNSMPDVSQVQARLLPTVANVKQIVDLNTVFDRKDLEAKFAPGFLGFGEVDGKQVALPWIGGTIGMVANTAVLEQAGVADIPVTVAQFRDALVKVRDNVPNSVPYAMATKNNNSIVLDYLLWVWTHGGEVIQDGKPAVNSAEAVAALDFMTGLVKDRLAAPEVDRPDSRRLFAQGAAACYFDAPGAKDHIRKFSGQGEAYDKNIRPVSAPVLNEGDKPASIQWGHVLVLYGDDNAKADSAGAKFLMHLLSDDVLIKYAATKGVLPSTVNGQKSEAIASDAYLNAWANASVEPRRNTIASLENGAEVANIIGEEVQAAVLGQKSPEDAANAMQARMEEAIGQ